MSTCKCMQKILALCHLLVRTLFMYYIHFGKHGSKGNGTASKCRNIKLLLLTLYVCCRFPEELGNVKNKSNVKNIKRR